MVHEGMHSKLQVQNSSELSLSSVGVVMVIVTREGHSSQSQSSDWKPGTWFIYTPYFSRELCLLPPQAFTPHFPHPPFCGRMRGSSEGQPSSLGLEGQCLSLGPCGRRTALPSFPLGESLAVGPGAFLAPPQALCRWSPPPDTHTLLLMLRT